MQLMTWSQALLYYDRKEDEDLPLEAIESAIANGEISISKIASNDMSRSSVITVTVYWLVHGRYIKVSFSRFTSFNYLCLIRPSRGLIKLGCFKNRA